jgi:L-lactate dehydrogenase complex protein LldG
MSDGARARILARLRAAPRSAPTECPDWSAPRFTAAERLDRFTAMLESVHAEVHRVGDDWPERLAGLLTHRGVRTILHAPATAAGRTLAERWDGRSDVPALIAYDRPVEDLKEVLVDGADAALTTALGGIAETGSLVLWPTPDEPRLMSLLPPVHVALVEQQAIADSLAALVEREGWAARMPTNALLISGPSKTADIEQTLAYGVHGPKELIVLIIPQDVG